MRQVIKNDEHEGYIYQTHVLMNMYLNDAAKTFNGGKLSLPTIVHS